VSEKKTHEEQVCGDKMRISNEENKWKKSSEGHMRENYQSLSEAILTNMKDVLSRSQ